MLILHAGVNCIIGLVIFRYLIIATYDFARLYFLFLNRMLFVIPVLFASLHIALLLFLIEIGTK